MSRLRRVWAVPILVGAASAGGVAGALLLEGEAARLAACAALAVPVAAVAWKVARARR